MEDNNLIEAIPEVMPSMVPKLHFGPMKTLTDHRRACVKVIKAVARGELDSSIGSKLIYMIHNSASIVKDDRILNELTDRLDLIEQLTR